MRLVLDLPIPAEWQDTLQAVMALLRTWIIVPLLGVGGQGGGLTFSSRLGSYEKSILTFGVFAFSYLWLEAASALGIPHLIAGELSVLNFFWYLFPVIALIRIYGPQSSMKPGVILCYLVVLYVLKEQWLAEADLATVRVVKFGPHYRHLATHYSGSTAGSPTIHYVDAEGAELSEIETEAIKTTGTEGRLPCVVKVAGSDLTVQLLNEDEEHKGLTAAEASTKLSAMKSVSPPSDDSDLENRENNIKDDSSSMTDFPLWLVSTGLRVFSSLALRLTTISFFVLSLFQYMLDMYDQFAGRGADFWITIFLFVAFNIIFLVFLGDEYKNGESRAEDSSDAGGLDTLATQLLFSSWFFISLLYFIRPDHFFDHVRSSLELIYDHVQQGRLAAEAAGQGSVFSRLPRGFGKTDVDDILTIAQHPEIFCEASEQQENTGVNASLPDDDDDLGAPASIRQQQRRMMDLVEFVPPVLLRIVVHLPYVISGVQLLAHFVLSFFAVRCHRTAGCLASVLVILLIPLPKTLVPKYITDDQPSASSDTPYRTKVRALVKKGLFVVLIGKFFFALEGWKQSGIKASSARYSDTPAAAIYWQMILHPQRLSRVLLGYLCRVRLALHSMFQKQDLRALSDAAHRLETQSPGFDFNRVLEILTLDDMRLNIRRQQLQRAALIRIGVPSGQAAHASVQQMEAVMSEVHHKSGFSLIETDGANHLIMMSKRYFMEANPGDLWINSIRGQLFVRLVGSKIPQKKWTAIPALALTVLKQAFATTKRVGGGNLRAGVHTQVNLTPDIVNRAMLLDLLCTLLTPLPDTPVARQLQGRKASLTILRPHVRDLRQFAVWGEGPGQQWRIPPAKLKFIGNPNGVGAQLRSEDPPINPTMLAWLGARSSCAAALAHYIRAETGRMRDFVHLTKTSAYNGATAWHNMKQKQDSFEESINEDMKQCVFSTKPSATSASSKNPIDVTRVLNQLTTEQGIHLDATLSNQVTYKDCLGLLRDCVYFLSKRIYRTLMLPHLCSGFLDLVEACLDRLGTNEGYWARVAHSTFHENADDKFHTAPPPVMQDRNSSPHLRLLDGKRVLAELFFILPVFMTDPHFMQSLHGTYSVVCLISSILGVATGEGDGGRPNHYGDFKKLDLLADRQIRDRAGLQIFGATIAALVAACQHGSDEFTRAQSEMDSQEQAKKTQWPLHKLSERLRRRNITTGLSVLTQLCVHYEKLQVVTAFRGNERFVQHLFHRYRSAEAPTTGSNDRSNNNKSSTPLHQIDRPQLKGQVIPKHICGPRLSEFLVQFAQFPSTVRCMNPDTYREMVRSGRVAGGGGAVSGGEDCVICMAPLLGDRVGSPTTVSPPSKTAEMKPPVTSTPGESKPPTSTTIRDEEPPAASVKSKYGVDPESKSAPEGPSLSEAHSGAKSEDTTDDVPTVAEVKEEKKDAASISTPFPPQPQPAAFGVEDGATIAFLLPCSHALHRDCLFQWLLSHKECPYCRKWLSDEPEGSRTGGGGLPMQRPNAPPHAAPPPQAGAPPDQPVWQQAPLPPGILPMGGAPPGPPLPQPQAAAQPPPQPQQPAPQQAPPPGQAMHQIQLPMGMPLGQPINIHLGQGPQGGQAPHLVPPGGAGFFGPPGPPPPGFPINAPPGAGIQIQFQQQPPPGAGAPHAQWLQPQGPRQ